MSSQPLKVLPPAVLSVGEVVVDIGQPDESGDLLVIFRVSGSPVACVTIDSNGTPILGMLNDLGHTTHALSRQESGVAVVAVYKNNQPIQVLQVTPEDDVDFDPFHSGFDPRRS
jgi:hypothetical protein